jgi:hypothetical protein
VDVLLELVDPAQWSAEPYDTHPPSPTRCNSQFLQVAVRNIVAAPVRDRIELDTMRELHVVLLVEFLELLCPPGVALRKLLLAVLDTRVVGELEFLEVCKLVGARRGRWSPSTCQPCGEEGMDAEGIGLVAARQVRTRGGLGRSYGEGVLSKSSGKEQCYSMVRDTLYNGIWSSLPSTSRSSRLTDYVAQPLCVLWLVLWLPQGTGGG